MPANRAASAKVKGAKANADSTVCLRLLRSPPPKPDIVNEGTKEYYLMQIRDLENRIAR